MKLTSIQADVLLSNKINIPGGTYIDDFFFRLIYFVACGSLDTKY